MKSFFFLRLKKWKNEIEFTGFFGGRINCGVEGISVCVVVSSDSCVIGQVVFQVSEYS